MLKEIARHVVMTETGKSQVIEYQELNEVRSGRRVEVFPGLKLFKDMNGNYLNPLPDGGFQEPTSGRLFKPV